MSVFYSVILREHIISNLKAIFSRKDRRSDLVKSGHKGCRKKEIQTLKKLKNLVKSNSTYS